MNTKRFFLAVIVGVLLCFGTLGALMVAEDPFFVLGGIEEGETGLFVNERYEMAGLIRHQDYASVLMGTSLVANYRASWFGSFLGAETLKITFPDGWITEFDTALDLAFRTHPELEQVYFCLDPAILIRPDSQRTVELPGYLYNDNPLDDVEYLLNAESYGLVLRSWLEGEQSRRVPLDDAYLWDGTYSYSRAVALASYPRPEISEMQLPADAYLAAAEENLDVVCAWIEEHPEVQFVLWFPAYSVLYWDCATRMGTAEAILTAVEYAAGRLLGYDNVRLHSFLRCERVNDLNYYTDYIHCSGDLNAWMSWCVLTAGEGLLTRENYGEELESLREFVHGYDYESLFN